MATVALSGIITPTNVVTATSTTTLTNKTLTGAVMNGTLGATTPSTVVATTVKASTTMGVGGATPSASGSGISFPATQSASSDANTLDDYEEGTWTPSIGGTATYSLQNGQYTKVGRVVHLSGLLGVSSLGTGSVNTISGLPFAAANNTAQAPGCMTFISAIASSVVSINPRIAIGTSSIAFNALGAAGNVQNDTQTVFQNGARVDFQITYFVTV